MYVVDNGTFVERKFVDDITSGFCFVVEIVGGGAASSKEKKRNGFIIKNIAVKLATWILTSI